MRVSNRDLAQPKSWRGIESGTHRTYIFHTVMFLMKGGYSITYDLNISVLAIRARRRKVF